jgi:hypothetical protein
LRAATNQRKMLGRPCKHNDIGDRIRDALRCLKSELDGLFRNATHVIHDRDPVFTAAWTELLKTDGVASARIAASGANCEL